MSLDKTKDPNMEFMVKLTKGEPALRILLSERKQGLTQEVEVQGEVAEPDEEGLLPAHHGDRKLYGGPKYMNFFDLGRKWDGTQFLDVSYSVAPTYDFVIGGGGTATYRTTTVPTLSQLEALQNTILDYPIEELEANHPRITKEEGEYFKLLLGDLSTAGTAAHQNNAWTDKGWKVRTGQISRKTNFIVGSVADPTDNIVSQQSGTPYFHKVVLTGPNKRTITEVNDPDGPVVEYVPKTGDKIFLMPTLPRPNSWARYKDPGNNHGLGTAGLRLVDRFESFDFSVTPRTPIFDSLSPYHLLTIGVPDGTTNEWHSSTPTTYPEYALAHKLLNFMESYGAGDMDRESVNSNATFNDWNWRGAGVVYGTGMPPIEIFPSETGNGPTPVDASAWKFGAGMFFGTFLMDAGTAVNSLNPSLPVGALMAVIKQASRVYYVWR